MRGGIPFPCLRCVLSSNCVTSVLGFSGLASDQALPRMSTLNRGDIRFEAGAQATSLYVVRSGAMSASLKNDYGAQQILGFSLVGA